jgi:hypothetical protein
MKHTILRERGWDSPCRVDCAGDVIRHVDGLRQRGVGARCAAWAVLAMGCGEGELVCDVHFIRGRGGMTPTLTHTWHAKKQGLVTLPGPGVVVDAVRLSQADVYRRTGRGRTKHQTGCQGKSFLCFVYTSIRFG